MRRRPPVNRTGWVRAAIGSPARLVATLLGLAAAAALVIGTIGPPLAGKGVFLTSDLIYLAFPWQAHAEPVNELHAARGGPTTDTVDVVYPSRAVFGEAARNGDFSAWNPFNFGGEPLGATSNFGQLNPLAWPFLFAPAWFAPALVKLAGLCCALLFTYLFCRRLGTDRAPAILGGVVFAGSGFIVMWNNWPQADVASLIPALFWATERFLQKRTASSAVPIAIALACLLLAQFPAVVGYTATVLVGYVAIRLACGLRRGGADEPDPEAEPATEAATAEAEGVEAAVAAGAGPAGEVDEPGAVPEPVVAGPPGRLSARESLRAGIGTGLALAAGVLLVAVILLPFGARLSSSELDREQSPDANLGVSTLITTVAPSAFGISYNDINYIGPGRNQVEAISYVGVVALVSAVAALALPRVRRAPPGALAGLAVTTGFLGVATFGGGPVLEFLQNFPVYDTNYIGRTRSILGFTVAAMAALGLQALLERGIAERARHLRWLDVVRLAGVGVAAAGFAVWVYGRGQDLARSVDRAHTFSDAMRDLPVLGVLTLVLVLLLLVGRGPARPLLGAGLIALATVQALTLAAPLLPNESRDTLYPTTASLAFLRDNAGPDRVVPEGYTLFANASMLEGIRSVTGHGFHAPTWKSMVRKASPHAFASSPTLGQPSGEPESAASPIYDRMGARWFAGTPHHDPFGPRETLTLDRADCDVTADPGLVTAPPDMSYGLWSVEPNPAVPVPSGTVVGRLRVPGENGLHGVAVRFCNDAELPQGSSFEVTAVGNGGTATGTLPLRGSISRRDFALPVPAADLAGDDPIDVTISFHSPDGQAVQMAGGPGGGISADLIRPGQDGLKLAYAGDLRIYERTNALPRIHWAGRSVVVEDKDERLDRLASGSVPGDTVVLSEGTAGGSGEDGRIEVLNDGDFLRMSVDAEGDGYVVVADGMQTDWVATVDGQPAELLDADHAGVAVAVPAGQHVVEIRYEPRGQRAGLAISVLTAAALLAVAAVSLVLQWRRRRGPTGEADPTATGGATGIPGPSETPGPPGPSGPPVAPSGPVPAGPESPSPAPGPPPPAPEPGPPTVPTGPGPATPPSRPSPDGPEPVAPSEPGAPPVPVGPVADDTGAPEPARPATDEHPRIPEATREPASPDGYGPATNGIGRNGHAPDGGAPPAPTAEDRPLTVAPRPGGWPIRRHRDG
jgi:hypothetical protein